MSVPLVVEIHSGYNWFEAHWVTNEKREIKYVCFAWFSSHEDLIVSEITTILLKNGYLSSNNEESFCDITDYRLQLWIYTKKIKCNGLLEL